MAYRQLLAIVVVAAAVGLGGLPVGAAGSGADEMSLAEALDKVAAYKSGDRRSPLMVVEGFVRDAMASPARRSELASKLTARLEAEVTTLDGKRFLCRQLALVGGDESVPALTELLPDEALSHMARFALERIPGEAAGKALRDHVAKTRGAIRIGVINSIGERRDPAAVEVLADVVHGPDLEAARAAADALGKIGNREAAAVLAEAGDRANERLRFSIATARLACADRFVAAKQVAPAVAIYRSLYVPGTPLAIGKAAFAGLVRHDENGLGRIVEALRSGHPVMAGLAARLVQDGFPGAEVTDKLTAFAAELAPARRAVLIRALGNRGDRRARPAAVAAARGDDPRLRLAGYYALGTLGQAADVDLLAAAAAEHDRKTEMGRVARHSLEQLLDPATDQALVAAARDGAARLRIVLIEAIRARRSPGAIPVLFVAVANPDRQVRKAAFEALGTLAEKQHLAGFTAEVAKARSSDLKTAQQALATACRRIDDEAARARPILEALEGATVPARCCLLRVLAKVGGDAALATVRADLESENAKVKDAAIRAISEWVDATPVVDVLRIARESASQKHRVLALRGYARMVGLESKRPVKKTVSLYRDGLMAARRAEEKRLMISGLAKLKALAALEEVQKHLGEEALLKEVEAAIVRLAEGIERKDDWAEKSGARRILKEAIPRFKTEKTKTQAQRVARRLARAVGTEV